MSAWWDLGAVGAAALAVLGPGREDARTRRVRRRGWLAAVTVLAGLVAAVRLIDGDHTWGILVAWGVVWLLVVVPFVVLFLRHHVGGADVRYVAGPLVLTGMGLGRTGLVWVPLVLLTTSLAQLVWRTLRPSVGSFAFVAWASTTSLVLSVAWLLGALGWL